MAILDLSKVPEEGTEEREVWDKVLKQGFTDKNQRNDSRLFAGQVDVTLRHYSIDDAARIIDGITPAIAMPLTGLRRNSVFRSRSDSPMVVAPQDKKSKRFEK